MKIQSFDSDSMNNIVMMDNGEIKRIEDIEPQFHLSADELNQMYNEYMRIIEKEDLGGLKYDEF